MCGTYRKLPADERRRERRSEYIPELCTKPESETVSVLLNERRAAV